MDAKTLAEAKADLEKLMDEAVESHEPIIITREGKPSVVLIAADDWNAAGRTDAANRTPVSRERLNRSIENANRKVYAKEISIDDLDRLIRASK